ncbi:inositol monophosphatase family protein [Mameliella sediminis]|uniref:inositol monophosphatase family protein n=1 Tax=Mameliella sediminis TaxID=2836866 RepID=UPI001C481A7C|nr:inositol monophosphatase [Mameliella sediminis]MBV7395418.1 inositol monophosphatase [Mameliella sediminis]
MSDSLPMPVTAPLTSAQRTQLFNLVRRAAKAEIMPRFRKLGTYQIGEKTGPQDLVTEADTSAEAMITRGLQRFFPSAVIIGEEAASANPKLLEKIAEAELCFTIDPVDGTWNFAKGLPLFGVMVSVLRFGIPVFGLLYDPVLNDIVWADSENSAQLQLPMRDRRFVTTDHDQNKTLDQLNGFVPLYLIPEDKRDQAAAALPRFGRVWSLRCACHEFRTLAQGEVDFVLFAKLTAWDQPAGVIVTQQAGGHVAMMDGSDYRGDTNTGFLLAASDKHTWDIVAEAFDFLVDNPAPEPTPAPEKNAFPGEMAVDSDA